MICNERRLRNIGVLQSECGCTWLEAREIESAAHATNPEEASYVSKMKQVVHNLCNNPELERGKAELVLRTDSESIAPDLKRIEKHELERREKFERMLNEKYEQVKDSSSKATIRCRRCGSGEIQWEQKQTRGADEAMSIFCCCMKCKCRWTLR